MMYATVPTGWSRTFVGGFAAATRWGHQEDQKQSLQLQQALDESNGQHIRPPQYAK
jgi:hypothetical protein